MTRCPACGREIPSAATCCESCGHALRQHAAGSSPGRKNPWSFSLAEMLIGTTYVCILLAVTLAIPEWGILLWALSAFALARTIWHSITWKRAGRPFAPLAQIGSFAESLLVMVLISAAATVAFFGTCLPLGVTVIRCCSPSHSEFLAGMAWVVGGSAGLASGGYLLWRLCLAPVVAWWRQGLPQDMVSRIAALGRAVTLLASTMIASALAAFTSGWIWMLGPGGRLDQRDERTSRIILYLVLLAGYTVGTVLGIAVGRLLVASIRLWFWPAIVVAAGALATLLIFTSSAAPDGYRDDSGLALMAAGVIAALIGALIVHRIMAAGRAPSNELAEPKIDEVVDERN